MAAAVQRVLASAQEGHRWPDGMPDSLRRQVIPGDAKCLNWALSAVEGKGWQGAVDGVRRALTEGDMAQPSESGGARREMQDTGVQTFSQYLAKCPWGRYGEGRVKSEGGRIKEDTRWLYTGSGEQRKCTGRWRRWIKEDELQQRCCRAGGEVATMSCCGRQKGRRRRKKGRGIRER